MITEFEFNDLREKLISKNKNFYKDYSSFTFDSLKNKIVPFYLNNSYEGRQNIINIKNRLLYKASVSQSFETHLQAYILQNIKNIKNILPFSNSDFWIGNEVSCRVGMQNIDILIIPTIIATKININADTTLIKKFFS